MEFIVSSDVLNGGLDVLENLLEGRGYKLLG